LEKEILMKNLNKPIKNKKELKQKYGRLKPIKVFHKYIAKRNRKYVLCLCDCGVEKEIPYDNLIIGKTNSCGCYAIEVRGKGVITHNLSKHPLYTCYVSMKERCYNPKNPSYRRYGERGIIVCEEWLNNFQTFYDWAIKNEWKKGLTIDRIDNDKNYEPDNCRCTTRQVQNNNASFNTRVIIFGEEKTVAEWGRDKKCTIPYSALLKRLRNNWIPEEALTTPISTKHQTNKRGKKNES
jgi:hypothetical protein